MGEQESFKKDPPKSETNAADLANEEEQVSDMDDTEHNEDNISEEGNIIILSTYNYIFINISFRFTKLGSSIRSTVCSP